MPREGILGGLYFEQLIYHLYVSRNSRAFRRAVTDGVENGILAEEFGNEVRAHELAITPYPQWVGAFEQMDIQELRTTVRAMDQLALREADKLIGSGRLYRDRKLHWSHDEALSAAAAFHSSYDLMVGHVHVQDILWFDVANTIDFDDSNKSSLTFGTYHLQGSICSGVTVRHVKGWAEISLLAHCTPPGFCAKWKSELDKIRELCGVTNIPARKKIWVTSLSKACRTPCVVFHLFMPRYYPDPIYILPKLLACNVTSVSFGDNPAIDLPWRTPRVIVEHLESIGLEFPASLKSLHSPL